MIIASMIREQLAGRACVTCESFIPPGMGRECAVCVEVEVRGGEKVCEETWLEQRLAEHAKRIQTDSIIPSPSEADFALSLSGCYRAVDGLKVKPAVIARAAIRLAARYRHLVECGEMTRAENDELASENGELTEEVERLRRDNAQIHEAQLRLTHALARIIERSEDSDVREIAAVAIGRVPPR